MPALAVCAEPGCPHIQAESRCLEHRREREQQRGTRQARGYDKRHDQLAAHYQHRMDHGERFTCWRCHRPLGTRRGRDWVLGHDDLDRTKHRGPECPACNYATASRRRISPGA